jgi:hypothetical protein
MSTLIIDSRRRNSGNSLTHFTIQLTPSIENVTQCKLVWADLPIPTGASESYYVVTIPQLGAPVRGANSLLSGTFVIPITSAGGYRTYWGENSAYHQIAGGNGVSLSNLDVHLSWGAAGGTASIGGDWTLIIQLA